MKKCKKITHWQEKKRNEEVCKYVSLSQLPLPLPLLIEESKKERRKKEIRSSEQVKGKLMKKTTNFYIQHNSLSIIPVFPSDHLYIPFPSDPTPLIAAIVLKECKCDQDRCILTADNAETFLLLNFDV